MPELKYFQITDFSPGIRDKYSPSQPPGTAQTTDTWGCVALPTTGLSPLPKMQKVRSATQLNRVSGTDYLLDSASGWHYNGNDPKSGSNFEVCGFTTQGGLGGPSESYSYPVEIYLGVQWLEHDGSSVYRRNVRVEAVNLANDLNYEILDRNMTSGPSPISSELYRPITFASTREKRSGTFSEDDQFRPGDPVVVTSWMSHDLSDWDTVAYPDSVDGSGGASPKYLMSETTSVGSPTTNKPIEVLSHQNRLVAFVVSEFTRVNGPNLTSNENISFSTPPGVLFDFESSAANTFGEQITFEIQNATGYTAWASITANQLLLIKGRGAVLITGSLESPTVVALPKVTGNATCLGAMSILGYVYPTAKGSVYAWQGDDVSTNMSPFLDTGFVDYDDASKRKGHTGLCAAWNDFVLMPNEWVLDERTAAWWRVSDPVQDTGFDNRIRYWDVPAGQVFNNTDAVYGAVGKYQEPHEGVICRLESDVLAPTFYWRSAPIVLDSSQYVQLREIGLTFKGRGTVHVDVFRDEAGDDDPIGSFVFDATASGNETITHVVRESGGFTMRSFNVRIRSYSHDGTSEAPTVYGLNFGYFLKQHIPNHDVSHRGLVLDRTDDVLDEAKLG